MAIIECLMTQDPNFYICTQLLGMLIDTKIRFRTTLPLPYLITQIYYTFIPEVEFKIYELDHVYLESEHVTMAYNVVVIEDQNLATANEDAYAFNLTQEEEDDVFDQDHSSTTREYLDLIWKGLGKFGTDSRKMNRVQSQVHAHGMDKLLWVGSSAVITSNSCMRTYTSLDAGKEFCTFFYRIFILV